MYYFLKYLAWFLVCLTMTFRRQGIENVPRQGPLLVVANHMSVSDPVLVSISLGRKVVFLAKEELFKNAFSAFFVRAFGAIPIYRGRFNREALQKTREVLHKGGVIGLFPEGRRSRTGALIEAQPGSALIAAHNRVAVLPVGISGTETIKGIGWVFRRPRVVVNIGEPFWLPQKDQSLNSQQLDNYSNLIMQHIAALIPEKNRGVYSMDGAKDDGKDNPA